MALRTKYVLDDLQRKIRSGGYIILVDKFYSRNVHERLRTKRCLGLQGKDSEHGCDTKERNFSASVQLPEKRKFFTKAGFEEFFRYGDFSGFIWRNDN